ncbi:zinc finger protein squeeze-like [Uranotaenia lowii]|uniref:zinc finger protein squeeze-like n=1 Tax=Uranotaenia lowii TaxID=190385 RepID=UPI00247A1F49|nr:zinc finger protein squeeze-like [Uranotaenia lowii]
MAEIPTGDYSHIHRSIDQLRSMNERGMLGQLNALTAANSTDLRSAIAVHEYKPYINDLRQQHQQQPPPQQQQQPQQHDRLDYAAVVHKQALEEQRAAAAHNNNNNPDHHQDQDQKPIHYSAPSTPPTPLSIAEHMQHETKRYGVKSGRSRKVS